MPTEKYSRRSAPTSLSISSSCSTASFPSSSSSSSSYASSCHRFPHYPLRHLVLALMIIYFVGMEGTSSKQAVLYDTTKLTILDWTAHPAREDGSGWQEVSWSDPQKHINNWRTFSVCDIYTSNVNNWLRTPFIQRGEAKRLYIEMKFSMRDCSLSPDVVRSCKETFDLRYFETDFDFATEDMPTWDVSSYRQIDRITADGRFSDNYEILINTEVRSVPISKKGVYFALHDKGACMSLLAMKIYFVTCENVTESFARFPETPTGPDVTSIVSMEGKCVPYAMLDQPPSYLCQSNGEWNVLRGGCKCAHGYEPHQQSCRPCPLGHFKPTASHDMCQACPANSEASERGMSICRCLPGFYRAKKDTEGVACTRPPTEPRNLSVSYHDQSSIWLAWLRPSDLGGRTDLSYRVHCERCGTQVQYIPSKEGFNNTWISISGLSPTTEYKIRVYAENGASEQSPHEQKFAKIMVTTEAPVPFKVLDLETKTVTSSSVLLTWRSPPSSMINYRVKFWLIGKEQYSNLTETQLTSAKIKPLRPNSEYVFRVQGKTNKGWGQYSDPISVVTLSKESKNDGRTVATIPPDDGPSPATDTEMAIIMGSVAAVGLCLLIIIIIILVLIKRSQSQDKPPDIITGEHLGNLEYRNLQSHSVYPQALFSTTSSCRSYVDPHTYEDPKLAICQFTREIDPSAITIESIIGGGEFGDVCKGRLAFGNGTEVPVAIKTLKVGASEKGRLDFLSEASVMGQFDDPNVIYLQGVVTKSQPIMIITEFMENGSLDTFLRANDGKLQILQIVGMLRGIASGMRYLADMNYIHRDLAARNILVNKNLVCKVADFGLSREIENDANDIAYTSKGGKIPVRWTAPEAIAYRRFTTSSDVWSYGIVMWEVISYGERPYWNWSNQDVIKLIEKGYRLPPVRDCPETIYQLMLDCWQDRNLRPKFSDIVNTLDRLIRQPELLCKIAKTQVALGDESGPDLTKFASVVDWLEGIKMRRYIDTFERNGICSLFQVSQLNQMDLGHMGITLVGHQRKMLQSIDGVRAQLFAAHENSHNNDVMNGLLNMDNVNNVPMTSHMSSSTIPPPPQGQGWLV